jgi:hypothetical protein
MIDDQDKLSALRAIRDQLVEQLFRLEQLDQTRVAADLNPAIERLNLLLGETPSAEEIERLRSKFFMN